MGGKVNFSTFVIECATLFFAFGERKMLVSDLIISNAYAEGAAPAAGGGIMDFLPLVALIAVFYFLVLRPQSKRAKEHKILLDGLQRGDEVVTTGGGVGAVNKVF